LVQGEPSDVHEVFVKGRGIFGIDRLLFQTSKLAEHGAAAEEMHFLKALTFKVIFVKL
jgi:hypothetical protein